jgi:replication fork clamp-binding protein CrfC
MDAGMQAALTLLGLTQEQLWAEGRNGRSLADLAVARGIDQSTLLNTMTSATASWLAEQVSAGRLSQSDADAILQRAQQFTAQLIVNPAPPPPPGGPPLGPPPQGLPPR